MQEPPFPRRPPKETKITLNLLSPCSKKEDARILKQKGLETIEKISQENFVVAYTDGSSDISLNKGGAGIPFQLPNKERKMHKINTGLSAYNFTSELVAIKEALILYSTHMELSGTTEGLAIFSDSRATLEVLESLHCRRKPCLLQWIPAHVNIEGNECADSLAKEGRKMMNNFVPPLRLKMQMRSQITDFCLIATKNPSLSILIALEILHP
ncbi:RNase H domain-containing protein [Trichonephila clavipes]|nr:RNase H domain-containing protein [Trichonephila clavipes]